MMAGAFTRNNAAQLTTALGRTPSEGELYIAHFLGADGAGQADRGAPANRAPMPPRCFRRRPPPTAAFSMTPPARRAPPRRCYNRLTGRFDVARALAVTPQGGQGVSPDTAGRGPGFRRRRPAA